MRWLTVVRGQTHRHTRTHTHCFDCRVGMEELRESTVFEPLPGGRHQRWPLRRGHVLRLHGRRKGLSNIR